MEYYRGLLQQAVRIEAFRRAVHHAVGSEDRVLEVGTGLGTYAFFAADAGANQVWAVEGHPVVHVAEAIARLNGYEGRVEFVRGWIPDVHLPDRATVLVFEDFPPRLLEEKVYRLFGQLQASFLEPGARVVPARASMFLAPLATYRVVERIGETDDTAYGIDWTPSRDYLVNKPQHVSMPADSLAAEPVKVSELEFAAPPETWLPGGRGTFRSDSDVMVSGLAYWFDLDLGASEHLSNAPGANPASWGQLLLPLDPPLRVPAGRQIRAEVRPDPLADGAPGLLRWSAAAAGRRASGHEFLSQPASFADLCGRSPDTVPRLSQGGRLQAEVLRLTDGTRAIDEIAEEIRRHRPDLSKVAAQCLVVGTLSGKLESRSLQEVWQSGG